MRMFTFFEVGEIYHERRFPERDRHSLLLLNNECARGNDYAFRFHFHSVRALVYT